MIFKGLAEVINKLIFNNLHQQNILIQSLILYAQNNCSIWFVCFLFVWLVFKRPGSNFSAIFRTRTFKNLNAKGLETRKGDGYGRIILPVQQVSYGPLTMSIMLIMSCNTGFFNVRRWWQSLNTGSRFYLRLIRRTGWL